MTGSSRYTRAISHEVEDIERRLGGNQSRSYLCGPQFRQHQLRRCELPQDFIVTALFDSRRDAARRGNHFVLRRAGFQILADIGLRHAVIRPEQMHCARLG